MSAPGRHARPRRMPRWSLPRWYTLPLPLALLAVLVMPWVAVRDVRDSAWAFKAMCDVFVRQAERLKQYEQPQPQRHLHLVK